MVAYSDQQITAVSDLTVLVLTVLRPVIHGCYRLSVSLCEWCHRLVTFSQPGQNEDFRTAAAQGLSLAGGMVLVLCARQPGTAMETALVRCGGNKNNASSKKEVVAVIILIFSIKICICRGRAVVSVESSSSSKNNGVILQVILMLLMMMMVMMMVMMIMLTLLREPSKVRICCFPL